MSFLFQRKIVVSVFMFAVASFVLSACGGPVQEEIKLPQLAEGINRIEPGGKTTCARNTPFAFYAQGGKINKLVIDFQGGGACWTQLTCSPLNPTFVESMEFIDKKIKDGYSEGVYDRKNPDNPFKDWYYVTIPYCTGDIHWGDNVATYGEAEQKVTIHHKGAVNARAVLDWIFKEFSNPETIFVTGCSAGGYGSVLWAAHIINHYKKSKIYQMSDSAAGVITEDFLKNSFPSWKAEGSMPSWIATLDPAKVDIKGKALSDFYINVSQHYSNYFFSQFNTTEDETQFAFYQAMGGKEVSMWSKLMKESIKKIQGSATNFRSFISSGKKHCTIVDNSFYSMKAGDVSFSSWLKDYTDGKEVKSLECPECQ